MGVIASSLTVIISEERNMDSIRLAVLLFTMRHEIQGIVVYSHHLFNLPSEGTGREYIYNESFDTAWGYIFEVPLDKDNPNHRIVPKGAGGAAGPISPNETWNERYSAGYDYLLKKYAKDCYNLKDNPKSKWYGTKSGKPCVIVICSYWHDGYTVFNESAKILAQKHGALYCDIANQVGFSYRQTDPTNDDSIRQSFLYCNNSEFGSGNDSEDIPIDGVVYTNMGWHATRDVNAPLTLKRGKILSEILKIATSDN